MKSALTIALVGMFFLTVGVLLSSWIIMLVWGGLASFFHFQTIPYKVAILVCLAITLVTGIFRSGK